MELNLALSLNPYQILAVSNYTDDLWTFGSMYILHFFFYPCLEKLETCKDKTFLKWKKIFTNE